MYCYSTQIIQLKIPHFLYTVKRLQLLQCNTNNSIQYQSIFYSVKWSDVSIWRIDGTLLGITTPGKSGPWRIGNKGVLHIPQSYRSGTSASAGCVIFRKLVGKWAYLSAEMLLACSTSPTDWNWLIFVF